MREVGQHPGLKGLEATQKCLALDPRPQRDLKHVNHIRICI